MQIAVARMFSAIPAHGLMGVFMGYNIGKAKFDTKNQSRLLLYGLLSAITLHTFYDFFLFLPTPNVLLAMLTLPVSLCLAIPAIKELANRSSITNPSTTSIGQVSGVTSSTQSNDETLISSKHQCQSCNATLSPTMMICYRCGAKLQR